MTYERVTFTSLQRVKCDPSCLITLVCESIELTDNRGQDRLHQQVTLF